MEEYIDLHVHSNISDGTMSPADVVKLAAKSGLSAIALTDHDTVDGIEEALAAGEKYGVEIIPGIEISADYKGGDLHILGFDIDYRDKNFAGKIKVCRDSRHERNLKMTEKIRQQGFDITWEMILERFGDNSITRAHFAKYLLDEGYVESKEEAFAKYLNPGCPCYVPREKVTPEQAVKMIIDAKGHPVLAHPMLYKLTHERVESVIVMLMSYGLQGIEAVYSLNSLEDDEFLRKLAKRHGLYITGGSDFHGAIKPDIQIGKGDINTFGANVRCVREK